MPDHPLHEPVLRWYAEQGRDLPWRHPGCSPWAVLVSEVMLQQTPVARVLPAWQAWVGRWPEPAALAAEPPGEAIRMWDRLGYPRRALRLHATAQALVERHAGQVPDRLPELRALPGIGEYTAAAVASFAFGQRHPVLDTNVRRVLARAVAGTTLAGTTLAGTALDGAAGVGAARSGAALDGAAPADHPPSATPARLARLARELLPDDAGRAARWAVASMELGALVCRARTPRCEQCPVAGLCRWRLSGHPPATGPARRAQGYAGTDRQVRGRLLAALRAAPSALAADDLHAAAPDGVLRDPLQRDRCLASLLDDGLVELLDDGRYGLPG